MNLFTKTDVTIVTVELVIRIYCMVLKRKPKQNHPKTASPEFTVNLNFTKRNQLFSNFWKCRLGAPVLLCMIRTRRALFFPRNSTFRRTQVQRMRSSGVRSPRWRQALLPRKRPKATVRQGLTVTRNWTKILGNHPLLFSITREILGIRWRKTTNSTISKISQNTLVSIPRVSRCLGYKGTIVTKTVAMETEEQCQRDSNGLPTMHCDLEETIKTPEKYPRPTLSWSAETPWEILHVNPHETRRITMVFSRASRLVRLRSVV